MSNLPVSLSFCGVTKTKKNIKYLIQFPFYKLNFQVTVYQKEKTQNRELHLIHEGEIKETLNSHFKVL